MKSLRVLLVNSLLALGLSCGAVAARAAVLDFSGSVSSKKDVASFIFTLEADATNVSIWTDSYHDGANFDPMLGLWDSSQHDRLVAFNDDFVVFPGQSLGDSGFRFASLAKGSYLITVSVYGNANRGSLLSDGFELDNVAPAALPSGALWNAHLSYTAAGGVPAVPEPASWAMLLAGLGLLGSVARRRN